jgi:hypothetical protein
MAGIFTNASQSLLRARAAQEDRAERERQRKLEEADRATAAEQRQLQQAALLAGLREQGIVPTGEATDYALPMFDGLASGLPSSGASMPMPGATRYQPLGATGFVLDSQNSRGAQQRVAAHEQERRARAVAEAQAKARAEEDERRHKLAVTLAEIQNRHAIGQIAARGQEARETRQTPTPERPRAATAPSRGMMPSRGGLTVQQVNEEGKQRQALGNLRRALDALESGVTQQGAAPQGRMALYGTDRARLEPLVREAQIQLKEAANLGAITGPDMELLTGMIGNPTAASQFLRGGAAGVLESIKQARGIIDRKAATMQEVYGRPVSTFGTDSRAAELQAQGSGDIDLSKPSAGEEIVINGKRVRLP